MTTQAFFKYSTLDKPPHLNNYAPGHNRYRVPGRATIESAKGTWGNTGINIKVPVKQINAGYNVNIKNNGISPSVMKIPYRIPKQAERVMRETFLTGNFMRVVDHTPGNGPASLYNPNNWITPGAIPDGRGGGGSTKNLRIDKGGQVPDTYAQDNVSGNRWTGRADVAPPPRVHNTNVGYQHVGMGGDAFLGAAGAVQPIQQVREERFVARNAFDAAVAAELPPAIPQMLEDKLKYAQAQAIGRANHTMPEAIQNINMQPAVPVQNIDMALTAQGVEPIDAEMARDIAEIAAKRKEKGKAKAPAELGTKGPKDLGRRLEAAKSQESQITVARQHYQRTAKTNRGRQGVGNMMDLDDEPVSTALIQNAPVHAPMNLDTPMDIDELPTLSALNPGVYLDDAQYARLAQIPEARLTPLQKDALMGYIAERKGTGGVSQAVAAPEKPKNFKNTEDAFKELGRLMSKKAENWTRNETDFMAGYARSYAQKFIPTKQRPDVLKDKNATNVQIYNALLMMEKLVKKKKK